MSNLAVIPARLASSRLPEKVLAELGGKSMLQRVYEVVSDSSLFNDVCVATDSQKVLKAAELFGARVKLTEEYHPSGTARAFEVYETLTEEGSHFETVSVIQGDLAFPSLRLIEGPLQCLQENPTRFDLATIATPFRDSEDVSNPHSVKVVTSKSGRALYFSRALIPFPRSSSSYPYLKHLGVYSYRAEGLRRYMSLSESLLEKSESLEQLRALEGGLSIGVTVFPELTEKEQMEVNTPEDLEAAQKALAR